MIKLFISLLVAHFVLCASEVERFKLEGSISFPQTNFNDDVATLSLQGDYSDRYYATSRKDGSFTFFNLPSGAYLMQVHASNWTFIPIRVDVSKSGLIKASKISTPSTNIPHPLKIEPDFRADYFMVREGFNVGSLLKNPMIIMMGVTFLMIVVLPKLMSGMDLEGMQQDLQAQVNPNGQAPTAPREVKEPPPKWEAPALKGWFFLGEVKKENF